jgi:colanic acid biosynthesis glycosyl transferase WcaI
MRILAVNQYFHPDVASTSQMLTELCEDLAEHHQVTVVAGRPSYNPAESVRGRGLVSEEQHGRVRVLRTWSTAFARTSMVGRVSNYATFMGSCLMGALRDERPNVILTMTDPPIVAAAAMVASRVRSAPFVYINQDIFPEVALRLGHLREGGLANGLRWLNRGLRQSASRVVVIGRDMRDRLVQVGLDPGKIAVIPNWADGSLIHPLMGPSRLRRELGWEDRFVVMHSGNVGLSQDLETLIRAAALLRGQPQILVAIVGNGASKPLLEAQVARLGLKNVVFLPYQPKASLSESLGAADAHIVSLGRGLSGFIVPSKVYGIMAAGKPFIAAIDADSEVALLGEEHRCGIRIEPGEPEALADAILKAPDLPLKEMGDRGRQALEERYDRRLATGAYRRVLEEVARGG